MIKRFTLAALTAAMLVALAVPASAESSDGHGSAVGTCLGLYETRPKRTPAPA